MTQAAKKIHEGRNVKRFREMLDIKQDTLAFGTNCTYPCK